MVASYLPSHRLPYKRRSGKPNPISWACGVIRNVIIAHFMFEHGRLPGVILYLVTDVWARARAYSRKDRFSASGKC